MDRAECAEAVIELQRQENEKLRADLAAANARADEAKRDLKEWLEAESQFNAERVDDEKKLRTDLAAADAQIKSLDEENATINAELLKARADLAAANASADKYMHKHDKALEALDEARTALSWMLLEGMDEAIPETCPVEYKRCVEAVSRIDAALAGGPDERN